MESKKCPGKMIFALVSMILIAGPAYAQEDPAAAAEVMIETAVICKDVMDREPQGAGDIFSTDLEKIMCFTRVVGAKEDTEILHNWYFGETLAASVRLHVGSDNWRTYSSKTILPEYAGEWKVEILASDGKLLKKIYFILE